MLDYEIHPSGKAEIFNCRTGKTLFWLPRILAPFANAACVLAAIAVW